MLSEFIIRQLVNDFSEINKNYNLVKIVNFSIDKNTKLYSTKYGSVEVKSKKRLFGLFPIWVERTEMDILGEYYFSNDQKELEIQPFIIECKSRFFRHYLLRLNTWKKYTEFLYSKSKSPDICVIKIGRSSSHGAISEVHGITRLSVPIPKDLYEISSEYFAINKSKQHFMQKINRKINKIWKRSIHKILKWQKRTFE